MSEIFFFYLNEEFCTGTLVFFCYPIPGVTIPLLDVQVRKCNRNHKTTACLLHHHTVPVYNELVPITKLELLNFC